MVKPAGRIIIEPLLNVWPHELNTAEALAAAGQTVEFIRKSDGQYVCTVDVMVDGARWEFRAPAASQLKAIERNFRRGLVQSTNLVFDSRRFKKSTGCCYKTRIAHLRRGSH